MRCYDEEVTGHAVDMMGFNFRFAHFCNKNSETNSKFRLHEGIFFHAKIFFPDKNDMRAS